MASHTIVAILLLATLIVRAQSAVVRSRRSTHQLVRTSMDDTWRSKSSKGVRPPSSSSRTFVLLNTLGEAIPKQLGVVPAEQGNGARDILLDPQVPIESAQTTTAAAGKSQPPRPTTAVQGSQNYRSRLTEATRRVPRPTHSGQLVPDHVRTPNSLYPIDHQSCRRQAQEVTVRRGGCKKHVQVNICHGTCYSRPRMLKKIPYVQYVPRCCRPSHSLPVIVDMNDEECQQQRLSKGKAERPSRPYKNVFLLSATACECALCLSG